MLLLRGLFSLSLLMLILCSLDGHFVEASPVTKFFVSLKDYKYADVDADVVSINTDLFLKNGTYSTVQTTLGYTSDALPSDKDDNPHVRQKRFLGALRAVGRLIGRGLVRSRGFSSGINSGAFNALRRLEAIRPSGIARITKKSGRTTLHYNKRGGINQARRDFESLNPTNIKTIQNGDGKVGHVNGYTVNYRKFSSEGSPTLEYFKTGDRKSITKIRYDE